MAEITMAARLVGVRDAIHPAGTLTEGEWWACTYPERPFEEGSTAYDFYCAKCRLKCRADIQVIGDRMALTSYGTEPLSTVLARFEQEAAAK